MYLMWSDLKSDVENLLAWKLKGLHSARFFGLREHPMHEVCLLCGKTVDFPISRKCPQCRTYQEKKNPWPQRHNGLDLAKARGTTIALPWEGKIEAAFFDKKLRDGGHGGGWSVVVSHPSAPVKLTGYCHLDNQPLVWIGKTYAEGQTVEVSKQGQQAVLTLAEVHPRRVVLTWSGGKLDLSIPLRAQSGPKN